MIKQRFVSGHVSSVYLSELLQRRWGNEREPWLEGHSPKQHQITRFFLFLPVHQRDMSQSNTVCHGIPRQLVDPTTNWRLMYCHLLSLPCLVVLRQITRDVLEKLRVTLSMQCGTCRGICLAVLELAVCDPEKLNRKNSLWNHTCLWCSHVDAFRARTSGDESTSYVRWPMIYILQAEQQGLDQKMHMCNKFTTAAYVELFVPMRKVLRCSCDRLGDKFKKIIKLITFNLNFVHVPTYC